MTAFPAAMRCDLDLSGERARAAALLLGLVAWIVCAGFVASTHHARLRPVRARPEIGRASYYGVHAAGRRTASGAPLRPDRLTAASPNLPLGTRAKVTNLQNGRSVDVTVTDRGPSVGRRILDVSPKAATRLDMRKAGVSTVAVKPLAVPASGSPPQSSAKAGAPRGP